MTDSQAVTQGMVEHGPFQILVSNAGMNRPTLLTEMQDSDLDAVLNLNVKAAFYVAREVVRGLLEAGLPGSLINISSQMGHIGSPNRTVYCATKHAIEGLTKAMAIELAEQNIRVNSVAPTFVDTPLVRQVVNTDEKRAFLFSKIPLGHLAETEDIAAAVAYLASPAARMVTGTCLKVDGGWTAQ